MNKPYHTIAKCSLETRLRHVWSLSLLTIHSLVREKQKTTFSSLSSLSLGTGISLTEGEGYQASESLPPGDRLPRSRQEEVEVVGGVTTGAKASALEENERREEEIATLSSLAPSNTWLCSWWCTLRCLLLHLLLCLRGWNLMFSFKGYNRLKSEEALILSQTAAHSGTQTLA